MSRLLFLFLLYILKHHAQICCSCSIDYGIIASVVDVASLLFDGSLSKRERKKQKKTVLWFTVLTNVRLWEVLVFYYFLHFLYEKMQYGLIWRGQKLKKSVLILQNTWDIFFYKSTLPISDAFTSYSSMLYQLFGVQQLVLHVLYDLF